MTGWSLTLRISKNTSWSHYQCPQYLQFRSIYWCVVFRIMWMFNMKNGGACMKDIQKDNNPRWTKTELFLEWWKSPPRLCLLLGDGRFQVLEVQFDQIPSDENLHLQSKACDIGRTFIGWKMQHVVIFIPKYSDYDGIGHQNHLLYQETGHWVVFFGGASFHTKKILKPLDGRHPSWSWGQGLGVI